MRLTSIKLAGFKSFVDPTTIPFSTNLSAVVGPNGCGKSNVIDAIRWVMGESHAKNLRGGSLTDVIFSGSTSRKPVGQATVELLFDNSQGKLGGEYANYAEIAIKRQVTRDGQSNYFLNGQRCRRRDITDIFLGTGLGPRSYAIIEQGMISRVIEAKPEDLRIFLEEAAGISKYKERRKETENRIHHTQENLARLNDLRGELDSQLQKLQRQSQAAERYKLLKEQELTLGAQLAALAWQRLDQDLQNYESKIRDLATQYEAEQAQFQHLKTEQEKQRIAHAEANETVNEVQKRYYSVGAEIARLEQSIAHHQERQTQLNADNEEAQQALLQAQAQLEHDRAQIEELEIKIQALEPQHLLATHVAEEALEQQHQAETALERWREKSTQLQEQSQAPTRQAEAEKARITQLERQIQQTQTRQERLENELKQLALPDEAEMAIFEEKLALLQDQTQEVLLQIEETLHQKEQCSANINLLRPQIKELEQHLNELQGQHAALCALQAAALGKDENARQQWLAQHQLTERAYLAEKISVQNGWELAVEVVLGGFLDAVGLNPGELNTLAKEVNDLDEVGMSLVEWQAAASHDSIAEQSLAACIQGCQLLPPSLYQHLNGVKIAHTLEQAREMLTTLAANQSIITPQGIWLGQGWIKMPAKQPATSGVLVREEKLKGLTQEIQVVQDKLAVLQLQREESEESLKLIELQREAHQQNKAQFHQEMVTLQGEQKIKRNRLEQGQKRLTQIQQELAECQELMQHAQIEINGARSNLQNALEQMSQFTQELALLAEQKSLLQEEVNNARLKVKETSVEVQALALNLQTYRTQLTSLNSNIQRFEYQIEQIHQRIQNLQLLLEKNDEPVLALKEELELSLEKRIISESELSVARDNLAQIDNLLRTLEKGFTQHEQNINQIRQDIEHNKMEWQALSVRKEGAIEKLKNCEQTVESLLATMPADATEEKWQADLTDVEQKIQRLGAINLAAIEEYEAALQRKEYLDSQCNDLNEAMTTLENAIKKIDRETRQKFKETFDKVNSHFIELFPRLFGGGQGAMLMTGEDLLDTGISIIARPPGKKNSTIAQLSGGEKALTAVALVFSIFQLNPAPFCLLDEVDAPLDDNNVGRFCNLVKEMSKTVQFIYISHNKVAMEMAEQLQGITMREPGVSRLVSVDIEEAHSMAQA